MKLPLFYVYSGGSSSFIKCLTCTHMALNCDYPSLFALNMALSSADIPEL